MDGNRRQRPSRLNPHYWFTPMIAAASLSCYVNPVIAKDLKMTRYHALYRIRVEYGSLRCPSDYYDYERDNNSGYRHVSLASELGDLNDTQLESLMTVIGQKHTIRLSADWETERREHGIIFLMSDTVYDNYGTDINSANKLNLKWMKDKYDRMIKDVDRFDATLLVPLLDCVNRARRLRKLARVETELPSLAAAPVSGKKPIPKKDAISCSDDEKREILNYAFEHQKSDPTIQTNEALAERVREKYPGVQDYHFIRWGRQFGIEFTKRVKEIRKAQRREGLIIPTSQDVECVAQATAEWDDRLAQFCHLKGLPSMTLQQFLTEYPAGSITNDEFYDFYEEEGDREDGIGKHQQLDEDKGKNNPYGNVSSTKRRPKLR